MIQKNKISHIWTVLCESGIVDSKSNQISLINVIEEFHIDKQTIKDNKIIVIPVKINLISFWGRDKIINDQIVDYKITFINSGNESIWEENPKIKFIDDKLKLRSIITLNGFKLIPTAGTYYLQIKIKENEKYKIVSKIPINLILK